MITCITERASSPKAGGKNVYLFHRTARLHNLRVFIIVGNSQIAPLRKVVSVWSAQTPAANPRLNYFCMNSLNWNICDKNLLLFVAFAFRNPATSPVWVALGRARLGWARWACSRLPWGAGAAPRRSRSDGWWPIRSGGSGRSSPYRPAAHPFCCLHPCIRLSKETSS